ncbi:MAG: sulfotransferase family 2 domain-containing protein [Pseudomonadota bacterium]
MQISHTHKFIFFSFPKTGSESIRELLAPYGEVEIVPYWEKTEEKPFYSHISPAETKTLFEQRGWHYDEYFKFVFVRNPWARLVSLYNMQHFTRPPKGMRGKLAAWWKNRNTPTFAEWLTNTQTDGPGAGGPDNQRWLVYGTYTLANYVCDATGHELVDEVIKLEEINERVPAVLQQAGIPDADSLAVPNKNRRPAKKRYQDYYDETSKTLVQQRYASDIERFGYTFDD